MSGPKKTKLGLDSSNMVDLESSKKKRSASVMKVRDVVKRIAELGGSQLRRGSSGHAVFVCSCGKHKVGIPVQRMEAQLPNGTLANVRRAMAPCWGREWLR